MINARAKSIAMNQAKPNQKPNIEACSIIWSSWKWRFQIDFYHTVIYWFSNVRDWSEIRKYDKSIKTERTNERKKEVYIYCIGCVQIQFTFMSGWCHLTFLFYFVCMCARECAFTCCNFDNEKKLSRILWQSDKWDLRARKYSIGIAT